MGTRGTISIELADKSVMSVYLAQDAYIKNEHGLGAGVMLLNHYDTYVKVLNLVSMGAIYSLKSIVEKDESKPHQPNINDQNFRQENVCLFFNRDLEQPMQTAINNSFETYLTKTQFEEFNYIFRGGKWYVVKTYYDRPEKSLCKSLKILIKKM